MVLKYNAETIVNPAGVACRVLDTVSLNFDGAVDARKSAPTLVRCAQGGERIETKNSAGEIESVYVATQGDAIFVNLHNTDDMYVPGNSDGSRWKFQDLAAKGYEVTGEDQEKGGVLIKSVNTARVLHEIIKEPTCIKDAWGAGQHQFLFPGASLKVDQGRVTGIDKEAFDATWEILTPKAPAAPSKSPMPKNKR